MFKVCKIIFILLFFQCLKKNKSKITLFFLCSPRDIDFNSNSIFILFFYSSAYRVNIRGKT